MTKWQSHLTIGLILSLMTACSSLESSHKVLSNSQEKTEANDSLDSPQIPFNVSEAFFPLRQRDDGKIFPSYQWKECKKRIIFCIKYEKKTIYYEDLSWFYANEFGLTKKRK